MANIKTVKPKDFEGYTMTLLQLVGIGPKFKIRCGECGLWFSERLQIVDEPPVVCPYCKTINVLPLGWS